MNAPNRLLTTQRAPGRAERVGARLTLAAVSTAQKTGTTYQSTSTLGDSRYLLHAAALLGGTHGMAPPASMTLLCAKEEEGA